MLILAATLALLVGVAHSCLGERYILIRLFRRELPRLFGSDEFTKQTLRFVWHLTTLSWWGFAAILVALEAGFDSANDILLVIAGTFGLGALFPLIATRGKHLSWVVFLAIAVLCYLASDSA